MNGVPTRSTVAVEIVPRLDVRILLHAVLEVRQDLLYPKRASNCVMWRLLRTLWFDGDDDAWNDMRLQVKLCRVPNRNQLQSEEPRMTTRLPAP